MKKLLLLLLVTTAVQAQLEIQTPQDYGICDNNGTGYAIFNLQIMDDAILGGSLDPDDYSVSYFETQTNAQENVNKIVNAYAYLNITTPQWIYVRVQDLTSQEFATTQFKIIAYPTPILYNVPQLVVFDEELPYDDLQATVSLTAYIEEQLQNSPNQDVNLSFYTSLDDAMYDTNPITDPQAYAVHSEATVYYRLSSAEGICSTSGSFDIVVLPPDYETPPPTAPVALTFNEGDTLGDIVLGGENIQWYDNDGTVSGPPTEPGEPLPLTTLLVDGTTYYATQTVYNIESNDRLAVTVNFTLGLNENTFVGLQYYPNPVKNILTIVNSDEIESVSLLNSLGQLINTTAINSDNFESDLSAFSSGIYFIRITSANHQKIIKVIKQ